MIMKGQKLSEYCTEDTLVNAFPAVPADITRHIKISLDSTMNFHDQNMGPPPPQTLITNVCAGTASQSCNRHTHCGESLKKGGLVLVNGNDVEYCSQGTYVIGVYKLLRGKKSVVRLVMYEWLGMR